MSEVDMAVQGGDCFSCTLPIVLKVKYGDCGINALVAQRLVGDMCLLKYLHSPLIGIGRIGLCTIQDVLGVQGIS
jgi:hypothetical protein